MKREEVIVKPTTEGATVILDDMQDFGTVRHLLKKKLQTEGLPAGTGILLELGRRQVSAKQQKILEKTLRQAGLVPKRINCLSGMPSQARNNSTGEKKTSTALASETLPIMLEVTQQIAAAKEVAAIIPPDPEVADTRAPGEAPLYGEGETLFVIRTLRSGHIVRSDGNVIILGDVNPGAEIVAGGHIVVMGYFRGMAHAGCQGNEKATVTAFRMQPTQLRIANHITRCPDGKYLAPNIPEVARVKEGVVVIESYQANPETQTKLS